MTHEDGKLCAMVQLTHGRDAAQALRDLFAFGDDGFARRIGRAALSSVFVTEKMRQQVDMRGKIKL